jgi:hypothetical protein
MVKVGIVQILSCSARSLMLCHKTLYSSIGSRKCLNGLVALNVLGLKTVGLILQLGLCLVQLNFRMNQLVQGLLSVLSESVGNFIDIGKHLKTLGVEVGRGNLARSLWSPRRQVGTRGTRRMVVALLLVRKSSSWLRTKAGVGLLLHLSLRECRALSAHHGSRESLVNGRISSDAGLNVAHQVHEGWLGALVLRILPVVEVGDLD